MAPGIGRDFSINPPPAAPEIAQRGT